MPVVPPQPRYTVEDTGDRLRIVIPSKKSPYVIFLAGFALLVQATVLCSVPRTFEHGVSLSFLVVFGTLEVLVLASVVSFVLWLVIGVEIVEVDQNRITVRQKLRGIERKQEYQGQFVWSLHAAPIVYPLTGRRRLGEPNLFFETLGLAGGQIAFEYFSRTVRFGASLNEAEAQMLVSTILQRFGDYDRHHQ